MLHYSCSDVTTRLAARKRVLDLIDTRRLREGDQGIGGSIERQIITEELGTVQKAAETGTCLTGPKPLAVNH